MKVHVLCPFYRTHFANTLVRYFESEGVEYYPIVAPKEDIEFGVPWVHNIRVKELEPGEQCFRKFNDFIDTQSICDNDYYAFACDETVFEPGFFEIIKNQTAKVIFVSAYRGDTVPNDGSTPHAAHTHYVRSEEDIRVGYIGLGQFIVKGSVLKRVRFKIDAPVCDGEFAVLLSHRYKGNVAFLTDWFVFSNYLQRGRFTNKEALLKSNWELPEWIE